MHYMNPARGKHMEGKGHEAPAHEGHGTHPHSIHIHHAEGGDPHPDNKHHVHIHHADGSHEHTDHGNFNEAMDKASSIGGPEGQDHGFSSGENMENEDGFGGPGV